MSGYLLSIVSLGGVVFFSFCLFLSDNLSFFWLFLELGTLSLVPSFFLYRGSAVLGSLFSYLVVSSVSSSLIVCGLLFEDLLYLVLFGFLIKFGVFPFFGWVYSVIVGSNWSVVWGFSTFLKCPVLFFCFFLSSGGVSLVNWFCSLSFLFLGVVFWVYTYSWVYSWCHMMVSSSVSLVAMSLVLSEELLGALFVIYVVWASGVVIFLGSLDGLCISSVTSYIFFVFLLVSLPFTFSIFYKFFMGFCMYSCFFFVFLTWVFYSISEQFYLIKCLVGQGVPSDLLGSLRLV